MDNLAQRVQFLEEKIMDNLEIVKENQENMRQDLGKIKEAVYHPDKGIYARLRLVEEQRKSSGRLMWFLFTVLLGSLGAGLAAVVAS